MLCLGLSFYKMTSRPIAVTP